MENFTAEIRHDWKLEEVEVLFNLPFNDLIFKAQSALRKNFDPNKVQLSTLLSIKTGGCPEDCAYCPQASSYKTGLKAEKLLDKEKILADAQKAKDLGAGRFCMGAAWRSPKDRHINELEDIIKGVKSLGLETCMTLGMLTPQHADRLSNAGLDYYNHNIDTSEEYYEKIISTRSFQDRLDTLENVRNAGMKVCCGGIVGMGEEDEDRSKMLMTLANMEEHPESVPINMLIKVKGTPLENVKDIEPIDFVKTIAVARIMMPKSYVRLSAGREGMSKETQTLCFLAGANSIFYGETLLTRENPERNEDLELMAELGLEAERVIEKVNNDCGQEPQNEVEASKAATC